MPFPARRTPGVRPPVPGTPHRRPPLRRSLTLLMCGCLLATLLTGAVPSARADQAQPALSATTRDQTQLIVAALLQKSGGSDPRYLSKNVWQDGSPSCFRCTLGPGVLSAARGVDSGLDTSLIKTSVATFDLAIKNHQRSDGAYVPAGSGESGPGIQTVLFANSLAWTYLMLGARLDPTHRRQWSSSLAKSADFLIRHGETTYYTNGNINLALAMNMDLTYRITHFSRFKSAAASTYTFLISPPQKTFPGFGLKYTKKPVRADGSDGSGYLAESGGGKPGYDPVYTLFQSNMASVWYFLTNSNTAKRLTNLTYNQLSSRVRESDWTIDVSGGTRRDTPGARYAFTVSALPVLALRGGRTDLQPLVKSQVKAALQVDLWNTTEVSPGMSYNYGIELATTYAVVTSTPFW